MLKFGLLILIWTIHATVWAKCPPTWGEYGDYCYYLGNIPYNWDNSRSMCQKRQADLVSFETREERLFVENLFDTEIGNYWIGMKREDNKLIWTDGTKPDPDDGDDVLNWHDSRPNNQGDCIAYTMRSGMVDDPCIWGKQYACKRPNTVLDLCNIDDAWHDYDGMCFKYFDEDKSWHDAKSACESQSASLAILNTQDKHDVFREVVDCKDYSKGVWIGLSDTDAEAREELTWVDGSAIGQTNWDDNQPNYVGDLNDNCVNAFTASAYMWRVDVCHIENEYVCEKKQGTCAEGWWDYGTDQCYLPVYGGGGVNKQTYTDAANYCEQRGGQLMKITNDAEQDALIAIGAELAKNNVHYVRIGISDIVQDNVYKWQDGSNIAYDKFNNTKREQVPNRMDCGYADIRDRLMLWGTQHCFEERNFICQNPKHTAPIDPPEEPPVEWECPPDNDWQLYGEECYRFSPIKGSYEEARADCADMGARLTSVRDPDEMSIVAGVQRGRGNILLGAKYIDGKHEWDDGSPLTFTNWRPDEPAQPENRQCIFQRGSTAEDHMWRDEWCEKDGGLYYVCRRAATHIDGTPPTDSPTVPGQKYCGPGQWHYNPYNNQCYEIGWNTVTWQQAENQCQNDGAHLVSIHNFHDQNFLNAMIQATLDAPSSYWIGLSDIDLSKGWTWTDGTPNEYFYWATGEPNNGNGEEFCTEMSMWNLGGWNDIRCEYEYSFICQKLAEDFEATTIAPAVTEAPIVCDGGTRFVSGEPYVQDEHFYAPSSEQGREPVNARIDWEGDGERGGSWTSTDTSNDRNYIQIRLYNGPVVVQAIQTQGAADRDEWVTKYQVLYKTTFAGSWMWYANEAGNTIMLDGNVNRNDVKENKLNEPILMTYIRLYPKEWNGKPSLRFDILACYYDNSECDFDSQIDGVYSTDDQSFSASDYSAGFEPYKAKFSSEAAWKPLSSSVGSYLQVKLNTIMAIRQIQIRGRKGGNEWVTKIRLEHSNDGQTWYTYMSPYGNVKEFDLAPTDDDNIQYRTLNTKVEARYVRFVVLEWHTSIAMRVEMTACKALCRPVELIDGTGHQLEDSRLSASSSLDSTSGPDRSRFSATGNDGMSGAWIAAINDANQYIQADFGYRIQVHAVGTRGQWGDNNDNWIEKFIFKYSRDGNSWSEYSDSLSDGQAKIFVANIDSSNIVRHYMNPHSAMAVRLYPTEWNNNIALRWEIYGCAGAKHEIGCYADGNERDLPFEWLKNPPGGMTHDICSTHCEQKGYLYAGAQYGNECFCGNSYGSYGVSGQCNKKCNGDHRGDNSTICGGRFANTIFSTGLAPYYPRCQTGWIEYNGRCFQFNTDKVQWQDAERRCMDQGGNLATVKSESEMNFIDSQQGISRADMWIGFHCLSNKFLFEWTSGQSVTYTNWARREPNGARAEEDCTKSYGAREGWNDQPCTFAYGYICEANLENIPGVTDPPDVDGCPSGWMAYRWKCFTAVTRPEVWTVHRDSCQNMGGRLARIEDSSEQAFLQSSLANMGGQFWTDLNDRDNPETYIYTNGQSPAYTNWGSNQPNTGSDPSCVFYDEDIHGFWFDQECGASKGAICEIDNENEVRPSDQPTVPPSGSCSSGWILYGDDCYQANEETVGFRKTYTDAYDACTEMGADLASIHSFEENDYLYRMGVVNKNDRFWVGLNRLGTEGSGGFKWTDDSEVVFTHWDQDQPSEGDLDNCVQMSEQTGFWSTVPCDGTKNWICKIKKGVNPQITTTPEPPTAGPPGSCSPDDDSWQFYDNKCYRISDNLDEKTWWDAQRYCNEQGGHLAAIHDVDTNDFLMGQMRETNAHDLWIGLNEVDGMGWKWSAGGPTEYTNWGPRAPDDIAGTALCVVMQNSQGVYGTWRNTQCLGTNPFICMKDKGGAIVTTPIPTPMPGNCKEGYMPFRDKCFKFNDDQVSWEEAYTRCEAENKPQSLAALHSLEEQGFLTSQLLNRRNEYWIGLHQFKAGTFGWSDNSPVTFTYWARHEPNGGEEEQCVHMFHDEQRAGQWNDAGCQQTKGYVCMAYKSTSNPEQPEPDNPCEYQEEGYRPFNGDCYKYASGSSRTWTQGEAHCQEDEGMPGHIASVLSPYEQGFIFSTLYDYKDQINPNTQVWLGLTDKEDPGRYQWADGNTVIYTNWGSNQPDYPQGGCARFDYIDSTWADVDCNEKYWTLCKRSIKDPVYTRPPADGGCPASVKGEDWIEYGDSCYLFIEDSKTFAASRLECHFRGTELASVHSDEENQFIWDHVKSPTFNGWWWTGLVRTPNSGWLWSDSSDVGFLNWAEGEPSDVDGTQGENCVEMYTNNGRWNDISCDSQNGYVCKVRRGDFSTIPTQGPSLGASTVSSHTTFLPGSSGTPPAGVSTPRPSIGGPEVDGSSGMSPGGVVGLVFFLLFLLLAAIVLGMFIMRRRAQEPAFIRGIATGNEFDAPGIENPSYNAYKAGPEESTIADGEDLTVHSMA